MAWHPYDLDREAQDLVLKYRDNDVLNESHKMRATAAFGLERFWGEHLRLLGKSKTQQQGEYWRETWEALVKIMKKADISVPNDKINVNDPKNTQAIRDMTQKLWDETKFPRYDRTASLAVLTQLCDSLVWWTQRYKRKDKPKGQQNGNAQSTRSVPFNPL
ncbi:hypothetical protein IQ235_09535 [Oscillatoriales cyanobacterium LEGE 11467]|uniref:Uncharacterized protein n=1 Tax=Zarconia navalis LEGE 11467 TaxID=1828826 RepID=A0A928Z9R1_9CYAN|nr:hypothetical protein [Zarconia navalis]MBE9041021.1 hypothetical protein [Zarconia navalis LEGE 11467]